MQDIFNNYLEDIKIHQAISQNTFVAYKYDVWEFTAFLNHKKVSIENIKLSNYTEFIETLKSKKVSKSTCSRKICAIKSFSKFLNKKYNYPEFKKRNLIKSDLPIVTQEQAIVKNINLAELNNASFDQIRRYIIIKLLQVCHISIDQLIKLELKNFNLITGFLNLNKKIIKLDPELLDVLKKYLKLIEYETKYLFPVNFQNIIKPISKNTVWAILRHSLAKNNNINLDKFNAEKNAKSIFDTDATRNIEIYRRTHPRENIF